MPTETKTINPDEPRKSPAMQDFENLIERLTNDATPADREKIADLVNPDGMVKINELTPPQASVLFSQHQGLQGTEVQICFKFQIVFWMLEINN